MLAGVIVMHGRLAEALRAAAAATAGGGDDIEVVSNDDASLETLEERVRVALSRVGNRDCIVFVDLTGGSCASACAHVLADHPRARVVTGANLPMVADFLLRRGDLDLEAMVQRVLQRGRNAVQELRGA